MEEVTISLYNKPVNGYKVLLDRNEKVISDRIIEHIQIQDNNPPFQFGRTIIYENILYNPILKDKEITLYFLLNKLQGQFTELTLVVMYDYRRSVSSREFPVLSIKTQADLARLVRRVSGDILKSNQLVFDDQTLSELHADNSSLDSPVVEHFKEEEVENYDILLHEDPFNAKKNSLDTNSTGSNVDSPNLTSSNPPEIQKLRARIFELEIREKQLKSQNKLLEGDQAVLEMKQSQLMSKLKNSKGLRDSVVLLNKKLSELTTQYYTSDEFSVSSETASDLQALQKQSEVNENQISQLTARTDSLNRLNSELQKMLANSGNKTLKKNQERIALAKEVKKLEKQNEKLSTALQKAKNNPDKSFSDQDRLLGDAIQRENRLRQLADELENSQQESKDQSAQIVQLKQKQDRLQSQVKDLTAQSKSLEKENRQLVASNSKPNQNDPALKDSLQLLKARVTGLRKQNQQLRQGQNPNQAQELQQKEQALSSTRQQLQTAKQQLSKVQKRENSLQADLRTAQGQARQAENKLQKSLEAERLSRQKKQSLQAELNGLKDEAGLNQAKQLSLQDSIDALHQNKAYLSRTLRQREGMVRKKAMANDSITKLLSNSLGRSRDLNREINSLNIRIDSLQQAVIPETDQSQFIRDQWSKLESWEKELKNREMATVDQEKLLGQKDKFLKDKETSLDNREASLSQIGEEQKRKPNLESPSPASSKINVKLSRITEFGATIPVFIAETNLGYKAMQQSVIGYMVKRNALLDEKFPDLVFSQVRFSELSLEAVDVRVRIDTRGSGSTLQISFESVTEGFLGSDLDRSRQAIAKKIVGDMASFKF